MKNIKLSKRYAKALYDLAVEQNLIDAVYNDMINIRNTIKESKELNLTVQSPIIKEDKKIAILNAIFGSSIQPITLSFLSILTKKNRELFLDEITEQFICLFNELKGLKIAYIKSAIALNENIKSNIIQLLKIKSGKEIQLIEKIDPSLIGGFILNFDGNEYNASLNLHLFNIKKELILKQL